jgi:tetratricopeptide (TPR) repeat protein
LRLGAWIVLQSQSNFSQEFPTGESLNYWGLFLARSLHDIETGICFWHPPMVNENYTALDTYKFALSCKAKGKNQLAQALFEDALNGTEDGPLKARCYLALGQLAELRRKYEVALDFYEKGLAFEPVVKTTTYFLNYNAGYCLNMLGRHREAEALCRKAIAIDPSRHNAWKNLGVSLEAQGDSKGAASAYVEATKIAPVDPRAFVLLQRLMEANPDLQTGFPGILPEKAACLAAITAANERVRVTEICRLKYIPWTGYFEQKEGVERSISVDELIEAYSVSALGVLDDFPNVWVSVIIEDDAEISQATSMESSDITPCIVLRRDR